jgi:hypothetical protein
MRTIMERIRMTWLFEFLEPASRGNRLTLFIAGLRLIGILGFALLTGYFVIQDFYLEATISIITVLAWIAVTTEAMDLVVERYL